MRAASRTSHLVGLLAVATVGSSTAVLLSTGVAQAAPSFTFSSDVQSSVTVPPGTCMIDWVVQGAAGGGSDGTPAEEWGVTRLVTTRVQAGDAFTLATGAMGDAGGGGGTNDLGGAAYAGAAGTGGDGGGGAATVVLRDGAVYLSAGGGNGAGAGGGQGGSAPAGAAEVVSHPDRDRADWSTNGAGAVHGEGIYCEDTPGENAPGAPTNVRGMSGYGQVSVTFTPPADASPNAITPYQYSVDGGAWTSVTPGWVNNGQDHQFGLALANGRSYEIRVRVGTGPFYFGHPSAPVTVTPLDPPAAATGVAVAVGPASLTVTWEPPAQPGPLPVASYQVLAVATDAIGDMADVQTCERAADDDLRCVLEAVPGYVYRVSVAAFDTQGRQGESAPVTSAVVPPSPSTTDPTPVTPPAPVAPDRGAAPTDTTAPAVPAVPPAGSGAVTGADGAALSTITPGATITLTGSGYAPRTRVDLYVYSTPQFLGTVVTDDAGAFTATVTLPRDLEAGEHHLVASGLDRSGNPRYLRTDVALAAPTSSPTQLAWTGVDVLPVAGAGLLALLLGAGLVILARRRAA